MRSVKPIEAFSAGTGEEMPGFVERIKGDTKILALLSVEEIDRACSIDRHLAHVDYIFERVFGVEGEV